MGTMDKILIILGTTTIIFISICFLFVWCGRIIPDSLIYSYFSAIGCEGFIMGWIKNSKLKGDNNENNK